MHQSTVHRIALFAQKKAEEYRLEEARDKNECGQTYDPHCYGAGYNIGAAQALDDFAENLWLMMNDEKVKQS